MNRGPREVPNQTTGGPRSLEGSGMFGANASSARAASSGPRSDNWGTWSTAGGGTTIAAIMQITHGPDLLGAAGASGACFF